MVKNTNIIDVSNSNAEINKILNDVDFSLENKLSKIFYYNQNEDQFIILKENLNIPSLPIHHELNNFTAPKDYVKTVKNICKKIIELEPQILAKARWFFNPNSIHFPSFYRIFNIKENYYLQLIRLDLNCRPLDSKILEQGSNDKTHSYCSNKLYIENDFYPLINYKKCTKNLELKQTIPTTWKGESGQGYKIHGIWMDAEINKFFSKLILPSGVRNHPYYPITCKNHCITMNAMGFANPSLIHQFSLFLENHLSNILDVLQTTSFSEDLNIFKEIKTQMPKNFETPWLSLNIENYLNDIDQKENKVVF